MLKTGTTVCHKRKGSLYVIKGGDHCMLKAGTTVCHKRQGPLYVAKAGTTVC